MPISLPIHFAIFIPGSGNKGKKIKARQSASSLSRRNYQGHGGVSFRGKGRGIDGYSRFISSGLCIFSRLISQKLLEQEGLAQSVISVFSWAIVEYFPSEGHLPSPRFGFSSSVFGDRSRASRGW